MKKILILLFTIILANPLFAKKITAKEELDMIGMYLSTYYIRNSSFPMNIEQLKQMHYFTETDVRIRLDSDERRYNMFIESACCNRISFVLVDGNSRLQLNLEVDDVQIFIFLENSEVYKTYQRDLEGNIIESEPYDTYKLYF